MRQYFHPAREDLELPAIFDALADPARLKTVAYLSRVGEAICSELDDWGSKTNMAYHLRRLREAGITRTRAEGTRRHISLRRDDLDARFPGLLDRVIAAAGGKARGKAKQGAVVRRSSPRTARRRSA